MRLGTGDIVASEFDQRQFEGNPAGQFRPTPARRSTRWNANSTICCKPAGGFRLERFTRQFAIGYGAVA
jgi:hypothetical protein